MKKNIKKKVKKKIKKREGFTLVELIGVLILLVVIFLLGMPVITALIKSSENDIDSASKEMIFVATNDYLTTKKDIYKDNSNNTYCIAIEDLINNGNLNENQLSGIDDEYTTVKVTYNNKEAEMDITGNDCQRVYNDERIEIVGSSIMTIPLSSEAISKDFDDPGITYVYYENGEKKTNNIDIDIYTTQPSNLVIASSSVKTKDIVTCSSDVNCLNQLVVDTYILKYEYTVSEGKVFYAERTVKVLDTEPPVITLDKEEETISVTTKNYDIKSGVTVSDNSGEIPELKATSNLALGKPGTYTISYVATDSSGLSSRATKKIIIEDPEVSVSIEVKEPKQTFEINSRTYTKEDILSEVYSWDEYGKSYSSQITYIIKKNNVTVSSVNTASLGKYNITYKIVKDGIECFGYREVNIVDTTKPVITFDSNTVYVHPEQTYPSLQSGVTVKDNSKETITATTSVAKLTFPSGNTQKVTYTATDSSGNSSTATRTYIRYDTPGLPVLSGGSSTWKNSNVIISIGTKATVTEGVDYYQYYLSTSSTSQTGGTWTKMSETDKITVSTEGKTYVYVRAISKKNVTGKVSAPAEVRIDKTVPTITVSISGKTATFTFKDSSGIAGYKVNDSTTAPDIPSSSETTGSYTATKAGTYYVWVKDLAGNITKKEFSIPTSAFNYDATLVSSTYTATLTCSGGRTLSGTNCTYYYSSNSDKCGSNAYDCNCWDDWYDCNCTSTCVGGNESYSCSKTCYKKVCSSYAYDKCDMNCLRKPNKNEDQCCAVKECDGYTNQSYSCTGTCTRYNSCLSTTQTCGRCGAGCNTCYSAKSCTVTENEYKTYVCTSGDTLSGTTCTHSYYTCPDGGTLSGKTCVR